MLRAQTLVPRWHPVEGEARMAGQKTRRPGQPQRCGYGTVGVSGKEDL